MSTITPDQVIRIIDIALAFADGFGRANELLKRARAGEEVTQADIDALVAESAIKRESFNEATEDLTGG